MIYLTTGLPRASKTLFTVVSVKALSEKEKRPVFYAGIEILDKESLPWTEIDPLKWFEAPVGAIIVFDEAWKWFRPLPRAGALPAHFEALSEHGHHGHDLVFITQHPMDLDNMLRRRVGLHRHVVRTFGLQKSTVHEWHSVKENCDKHREDAAKRHDFVFPKRAYGWYKSSAMHTVKVNIPPKVWLLLGLILLVAFIGWRLYNRFNERSVPPSVAEQPASSASGSASQVHGAQNGPAMVNGPGAQVLTAAQYVQRFQPRVAGLDYTAPAYDEITKPVRAPYPAACVQSRTRCQCYSQQGTRLEVPKELCSGIAANGFFMAWDENKGQQRMEANKPSPLQLSVGQDPLPGLINATPGYAPSNSRPLADQVADGQNLRHGRNNRIPG